MSNNESQSQPFINEGLALAEANKLKRQGYNTRLETRSRIRYGGPGGRYVQVQYLYVVVFWK